MNFRSCIAAVVLSTVSMAYVFATPITVGTGSSTANVLINWGDGYYAEFAVKFDGTQTGMDLLATVDSALHEFTMVTSFGGMFVDGFIFNGHSNIGFGDGENWWHYWVNDGQGWDSPWTYGASDRIVSNGVHDGWVYGNANAPVPEPITMALLGLGGLLIGRKK